CALARELAGDVSGTTLDTGHRIPPGREAWPSIAPGKRKSRGSPRDSTPLFARLEPYRSRFRAGVGTLLAFCRLPGGRRARTLAPLLIAGEHSTRSAGCQLGAYNLLWSMKKEFNVVVERDREGYYVA